jgi:hypothetical protein
MSDKQAVIAGEARGDETFNKDLTVNGGRGLLQEGRKGDWCQTWTGTRFYPADPRPEDVKIEDIVIGLGNMARYNGQCRFYSVAEHAVLVSKMLEDEAVLSLIDTAGERGHYSKEELAWIGLHHDDPEFLMADMTRPFKRNIGRDNRYFQLEQEIWELALAPAFNLPKKIPQIVINADVMLLGLEKRVLHPRSDPWDLPFGEPRGYKIHCWQAPYTQWLWLRRYCDLAGYSYPALQRRIMDLMAQDREALDAQFEPGRVTVREAA